jgi:CHAT domain-containing protein
VPAEVLMWLWETAAEPLLAHLRIRGGRAPEDRPRLWWSPVGALAVLPLHAAGRHSSSGSADDGPGDCVPERVVSSYAPTLSALLRARNAAAGGHRQLAVGMSRTPRLAALPGVVAELAVLSALAPTPDEGLHLVDQRATRGAVLAALVSHPWVHFACHGLQHETVPSRSAFQLWDGPLTVDDLSRLQLVGAELAFLSACETATGSPALLDEALHLAAVMQLLGYRHVIGTLWTIADAAAPEVADSVYRRLLAGRRDLSSTAAAVHAACEELRRVHPDRPLLWAPYVHFGP